MISLGPPQVFTAIGRSGCGRADADAGAVAASGGDGRVTSAIARIRWCLAMRDMRASVGSGGWVRLYNCDPHVELRRPAVSARQGSSALSLQRHSARGDRVAARAVPRAGAPRGRGSSGVSAARRTAPKPPACSTSRSAASPAWVPEPGAAGLRQRAGRAHERGEPVVEPADRVEVVLDPVAGVGLDEHAGAAGGERRRRVARGARAGRRGRGTRRRTRRGRSPRPRSPPRPRPRTSRGRRRPPARRAARAVAIESAW